MFILHLGQHVHDVVELGYLFFQLMVDANSYFVCISPVGVRAYEHLVRSFNGTIITMLILKNLIAEDPFHVVVEKLFCIAKFVLDLVYLYWDQHMDVS